MDTAHAPAGMRHSVPSSPDDRVIRAHEPMRFGSTLLDAEHTRFRFWAPALQTVTLEIEGLDPIPMQPREGGWFEVVAPCGAGAAYRYRVKDDLAVPDPAARAMRGDANGHSLVVDPSSYTWRNTEWRGRPWSEAVFYELHVGAFGGFSGVKEALPKLAALGITAVELMPINAFPGALNWGYDGVLPFAPSSAYGEPDELKDLIDTAHEHGLMMFLDVVYNHFGPAGNYLGVYAPTFFRNDMNSPWGSAIDFSLPEVRSFYAENAFLWLEEFHFDGLRFDAVHAITHPDWLDETSTALRKAKGPERHIHLVLENDDNVATHMREGYFEAQWNDDGHHVLHVLLTGETTGYYGAYADEPAKLLARCLSEGFVYQGQASSARGGEPRGTPSDDLPPSAFVLALQNHDQIGNRAFGERLTTLAGEEALEAATALQLLCPQIPLIFMGEENASKTPFLFFAQHNEELAKAIREGRKREFDMAPAQAEKMPDPSAPSTFYRSIPTPDPERGEQRAALYRRLLALRHEHISPCIEGARSLGADVVGPAAVIARWRMGNGAPLTIAVNLGGDTVDCPPVGGTQLFESRSGRAAALANGRLAGLTTVVTM